MNASARAPMSPDCSAPPFAILNLISLALGYPPSYTACGESSLARTLDRSKLLASGKMVKVAWLPCEPVDLSGHDVSGCIATLS